MGLRPARMAHQNLIGPHWKSRNARNKGISRPSQRLRCFVSHVGFQSRLNLFFPYMWEKNHPYPSKKPFKKRSPNLMDFISSILEAQLFCSHRLPLSLGNGQSFRFRVAWTMAERTTMFEEKKKDRKRSTWRISFQWLVFFVVKNYGNSCISLRWL